MTIEITKSRLTIRDLLTESASGILQRPARSALTGLGTVLGVAAFLTILGLTATASSQVDTRFNALVATQVTVTDVAAQQNDSDQATNSFPTDAERRVDALHGVQNAGVYWTVDLRTQPSRSVSGSPVAGPDDGSDIPVIAATPGLFPAAGTHLSQGRTFDQFHQDDQQHVALIGDGIAGELGISTLVNQPAIFIAGQAFTVIGIIDATTRQSQLLLSVSVPASTATELWGPPTVDQPASMLISTRLGAAKQVAQEAPFALRPDHPGYFRAIPPDDPTTLRSAVTSDLAVLFLLLAGVCLIIGGVSIANTTLVAVLERTSEIGLRRALGARRPHITAQFLSESAVLGAFSGLAGTSIGVITIVIVALTHQWTPVLAPTLVIAAPVIGLLTGVLAGCYPAWRASRIEPADALRR